METFPKSIQPFGIDTLRHVNIVPNFCFVLITDAKPKSADVTSPFLVQQNVLGLDVAVALFADILYFCA